MSALFVTGAAGFIGSHFCRYALQQPDVERVVAFDKLTYAGNLANLDDLVGDSRLTFVRGDICDAQSVLTACKQFGVNRIVNFAAESHVDRSIVSAAEFVRTNVSGTQVLLDVARSIGCDRFVQVSTDEVYGSLPLERADLRFTEDSPLAPNSPYAASKAAGDCLARAFYHTYGLPVMVTRCSNNFGTHQFPEKLIPLFIIRLSEGKKVPLYGDGLNVRDWLHVTDHAAAIWQVLTRGQTGAVYNIGGNCELNNRQVTAAILAAMNRQWDASVEPVADRAGHDRRYAIDASRISGELGWQPTRNFDAALVETVQWYMDNTAWWRSILNGEYLNQANERYPVVKANVSSGS